MPVEISYITAFFAGLLGGVHCLGMCGGIVGALTFGIKQDDGAVPVNAPASDSNNIPSIASNTLFPYILAYNGGRLFSYTIAGILVGGISMLATNLPVLHNIQFSLQIFAAVFMIALGLYIGGWWFGLRKIEKAGGMLWKHIEPVSRKFIPVKSPFQAFILGTLWGWLPCGLVYTILIWSISTGSAIEGGLLMLSFGLGTLPLLLAMGVFATSLTSFIRKNWVRALAGGIIIAFGVFSLFNLSIRMQA
ncbi:MAG: sulfite exporter TauE/SafE family protein [gamma proteobacterium symbiont of Bathyaustriella thionipta]|nr:sulfite exporter TauE/SafE family protein [gamma proteobacterium symbiont of Bathyaustriella thionipta]MCU7948552.1 sulfite exporter TauE/SafE family protein [gamma proteobacterium symbiont of Bathyaustriella thionipta]MCU7954489.1 sulfite exporter TauE/SafE family protein [gamma proteobacterium symbiont of Bathyaustriella thionipta]MCU7955170.1 sulfite exporter TauE/SafE family protein [gamma proteobacterium symbiont of Bathyaustriella thionipta]MCU7966029.1 sulfite exporter TauE/SafE famil